MANISISVTTSAGTVTYDSPNLSDAAMDRLINFCLYAYPQEDEDGNPLPVTNAVKAAAIRDWGAGIFNGTKDNVLNFERNEAAQAAREAVAGIE